MLHHPELTALLEQARRNLDTLELLARSIGQEATSEVEALQQRLRHLKAAYTRETDALTREVLERAIDRRKLTDRRQPAKSGSG